MNSFKHAVVSVFLIIAGSAFGDAPADEKTCLNQLREISSLHTTFTGAHHGRLPKTFDELLSGQKTPDRSILLAPLATDKTKPSYELLLPAEKLAHIVNPSRTIIIRAHYVLKNGGTPVVFADGHAEILDKSDLVKFGLSSVLKPKDSQRAE